VRAVVVDGSKTKRSVTRVEDRDVEYKQRRQEQRRHRRQ